jgi:hypothetical protein
MLFIFQTPELIRKLWQLKTAVFLHLCLILAVPFIETYLRKFCEHPTMANYLNYMSVALQKKYKIGYFPFF